MYTLRSLARVTYHGRLPLTAPLAWLDARGPLLPLAMRQELREALR